MSYDKLPGINVSKLKDAYSEGWAYFAARHVHKTMPPKEKKVFAFGSAVHLALLKPDEFKHKVHTPPRDVLASNGARSTKAYKEWAASLPAGSIELTEAEMDACHQCLSSILQHDEVCKMMSYDRITEEPISCKIDGLDWKGIPDIVLRSGGIVIDLKTTACIGERKFRGQAFDLGYHLQAAWYLRLCSEFYRKPYNTFVFIAIESDAPYRCRCYYLDDDFIEEGRAKIAELIEQYQQRLASNYWLEDCDRGLIRIGRKW